MVRRPRPGFVQTFTRAFASWRETLPLQAARRSSGQLSCPPLPARQVQRGAGALRPSVDLTRTTRRRRARESLETTLKTKAAARNAAKKRRFEFMGGVYRVPAGRGHRRNAHLRVGIAPTRLATRGCPGRNPVRRGQKGSGSKSFSCLFRAANNPFAPPKLAHFISPMLRRVIMLGLVLLLAGCASWFKEPSGPARRRMEADKAAEERPPDLHQRSTDESEFLRKQTEKK